MNWEAIKHIYKRVLVCNNKIEYLGEDRYKLTSFHRTGGRWSTGEYKNGRVHGTVLGWDSNGQKCFEGWFKNGQLIDKLW